MTNRPYNDDTTRRTAGRTGRPQVQDAPAAGPASRMAASRAGASGTGGPEGASAAAPGRKRTVLVVAGVVVAAVAIWLLVWLFACNGASLLDPNAQTGQAPYKSEAEMQAELDRVVEEGMFNISIASTIQFADGTAAGTAYIENVPGNRYNMRVSIADDATSEVLYESGVLSPNQYIEDITLSRDLEPGTYEATATFVALDPTTYEQVGEAAAKIALVVQG